MVKCDKCGKYYHFASVSSSGNEKKAIHCTKRKQWYTPYICSYLQWWCRVGEKKNRTKNLNNNNKRNTAKRTLHLQACFCITRGLAELKNPKNTTKNRKGVTFVTWPVMQYKTHITTVALPSNKACDENRILTVVLCNIGYPSETHLKLKSRENSFVHNIRFNCPIGLKFCTDHDSAIVVLCIKFQSDQSTEALVMGKREFASFEFKMNFGRISYIAQGPWCIMAGDYKWWN